MTPVEALELALNKESNSIRLYNRLAGSYSQLRELFLMLINEEEKHKKMIEAKIREITR